MDASLLLYSKCLQHKLRKAFARIIADVCKALHKTCAQLPQNYCVSSLGEQRVRLQEKQSMADSISAAEMDSSADGSQIGTYQNQNSDAAEVNT